MELLVGYPTKALNKNRRAVIETAIRFDHARRNMHLFASINSFCLIVHCVMKTDPRAQAWTVPFASMGGVPPPLVSGRFERRVHKTV
ncbi:MAG: hypothetical protein H6872_02515 [Methylobacteriaceae bacterium]|nr:hypothetical protein [Methylobacteriaceae bacterium]